MYVNFKPEFAEEKKGDFSLTPSYAKWTEEAVQKIPQIVRQGIECFCQKMVDERFPIGEPPAWTWGLEDVALSQLEEVKKLYHVERLFSMEWGVQIGDEYLTYTDDEIGYL